MQLNFLMNRIYNIHAKAMGKLKAEGLARVGVYSKAGKPTLEVIHMAISKGEVKLRPRTKATCMLITAFYNLDGLEAEAKRAQALLTAPSDPKTFCLSYPDASHVDRAFTMHFESQHARAENIQQSLKDSIDMIMLGAVDAAQYVASLEAMEF